MKTHRSLAIALVLIIMISMIPTTTLSAQAAQTDGVYQYTVSNGEAKLTGLIYSNGLSGTVTLPSSLGGYPVTSIGSKALIYAMNNITSLIIPSSVKTIDRYAFDSMRFTSISIPNSVTSIGASAFYQCYSLASVILPNSLTAISDSLFYNCGIYYVVIPKSVVSIGDFVFYRCANLTDIYYTGSEQDKARINIRIDYYNPKYATATWHYNCNPSSPTCTHSRTEIRNAVSATCTASGYTGDTYCKNCGYKVSSGRSTSSLGHSYRSEVIAPTCTANGYTRYACVRCTYSYTTNSTAALGHDYVASVHLPTCTERGYTAHTCSRCDSAYNSDYTDATGHTYGESGEDRYVCTVCHEEDEERWLAALRADRAEFDAYRAAQKLAADDLAEEGDSEACLNLIEAAKAEIDAMGYAESVSLEENKGAVDLKIKKYARAVRIKRFTEFCKPGDADGNNKVDVVDATFVKRFATEIEIPFSEEELMRGDVDKDDSLTIVDALLIQRYATGIRIPYEIG